MAAKFFLIWFLVSLLEALRFQSMLGSAIPPKVRCAPSTNGITLRAKCSHLNLTSVPHYLPPDLKELDLSFNNITALWNVSFSNYRSLQVLNMEHNHLSVIESGAFRLLTELKILDMNNNEICHVPTSLFATNTLLSILGMAHNELQDIPNAALNGIRLLKNIYLRNNLITRLKFAAFSAWENVTKIDLSRNNVTSLRQQDFRPLQNCTIRDLILSSNKLRSLPGSVFTYLFCVENLHMDNIQLQTFEEQSFMGSMKIKRLSLTGSRIKIIMPLKISEFFGNDSSVIEELNLHGNLITHIPDFAFRGFQKLTNLDLGSNRISSLTNFSVCGLPSLTSMTLSQNRIRAIPLAVLKCTNKLQSLLLSHNSIKTLNPLCFQNSQYLVYMDLHGNQLAKVRKSLWNASALRNIDLSHNQLKSIDIDMFRGLEHLTVLNISENVLQSIAPDTFEEMPYLTNLMLRGQEEFSLNGTFAQMRNLVHLDLSVIHRIEMTSIHQFTNTSSLKVLNMSHINLAVENMVDKKANTSLFKGLTYLHILDLQYNNMWNINEASWLFSPLRDLLVLNLRHNKIPFLRSEIFANLTSLRELNLDVNWITAISENAFRNLHSLQVLILMYNQVQALERNLLAETPNLTRLYLQGNRISTIVVDSSLPPNLTYLDIHGNPFNCDCQLAWFTNRLHKSSVTLDHQNETQCSSSSLTKAVGTPLMSFNPDDFCRFNIYLATGISLTTVISFFLLVITYRKRWWLKYKFFLLKLFVLGYEEIIEDRSPQEYAYQLNIMFHHADALWVDTYMKPELEKRISCLRNIVYGDDNLHLGMYYVDALYHAIENSFKTVLLISNQSIDDVWFMTKLRMAVEHVNETRLEKVILVFLEDIDDDHLPYLVRLLLSRNKPYMLWTEDEDGQELFWAQFEKSMRENRGINHAVPV